MAASPKFGNLQANRAVRLEPGDILTPKQLATRLQVPVSWVYKHTDNSRKNGNRLARLCAAMGFFASPGPTFVNGYARMPLLDNLI